MAINLIDLIKGQLGPAVITQTASHLGESESGISKAISALLPAVVGGMANNAQNSGLVDALRNGSYQEILGNLTGAASGNSLITTLAQSVFGSNAAALINGVASYAGISNTSSSSLLNMVTGATVGSVGKYAADNNLSGNEIETLLKDQRGVVSSLLPAGLSLASLGLGSWGAAEDMHAATGAVEPAAAAGQSTITDHTEPKIEVTRGGDARVPASPPNNGGGSIWKWLLPLLLLVLAGWFMMRQCDKNPEQSAVTTNTDSTRVSDSSMAVPADTGATAATMTDEDIDLNGAKLRGYRGGMEDSMINFLKSGNYKSAADDAALKDTWYNFDKVNFKMGSASELEPNSEPQLENLVAILKAYPDAKIKIGGYTDKTGDAAVNKKLSQDRADYIKKWLSDKGVGAQVIGADGYGSEFATVDPAASDAERAADRKMAVRFVK